MKMLVLSIAVALSSQGASVPATPPLVSSIGGAFFAVSAADIEASTRWYAEKLGMHVTMALPKDGKASVTVLEGGRLTVELIQHDDATPAGRAPELVRGIFKSGIVVDDFEAVLAQLKARGVPIAFGPYPARGSSRSNFIIRDNEGNLIQFFGK
jgi:catechol 2,3-dioxygenase-like lactoylglutathione lyase family enzyme